MGCECRTGWDGGRNGGGEQSGGGGGHGGVVLEGGVGLEDVTHVSECQQTVNVYPHKN